MRLGRTFTDRDTEQTRAVAVVNEALASQWLDGLEPVGARLLVDDNDGSPRPVEIVGVVGNVRQATLDGESTWDLYLTYPQIHPDNVGAAAANMFWIVRTEGDPLTLAPAIARNVRRIDPVVAASQIRPMDHYLADAMAPRRFSVSLMTAFATAALALAIIGIYAVVVYSVSQRGHEIGVRIALGASRSSVMRLVMEHGVRSVVIGLGAGLAMAVAGMRLLSSMLFGVSPTDIATFGQVACVVATVSVIACALPTVRLERLVKGVFRAE